MKATGIVRRIDDLGRVVIPKEIRRTMHVGEYTPIHKKFYSVGYIYLCIFFTIPSLYNMSAIANNSLANENHAIYLE